MASPSALHILSASASSTLNEDEDTYGAQHCIDQEALTCWNSDGGSPQQLTLQLAAAATVAAVELTFQGGFVGQAMQLATCSPGSAEWSAAGSFEPEDCNVAQLFQLPQQRSGVLQLRITFGGSTDFYGRVTIYKAVCLGWA